MSKPTADELEQALTQAKHMREAGEDPYHMGKALLHMNYQRGFLQQVLQTAERYLHGGLSEREHTLLLRAIKQAHDADDRSAGVERDDLGLG